MRSSFKNDEKLPFSRNEMKSRTKKIREEMGKRGVDCLIAQSYHHFYYVSGAPLFPFGRPCAVILPLDGEPTIIESSIELSHTQAQSYIKDFRTYSDLERPPLESAYLLIKRVLEEKDLNRSCIGFEDESIPYYFYEKFKRTFPEAKFVGISNLLNTLRMVKSKEELNYIRIGSDIVDLGVEKLFEIVEPKKLLYKVKKECRDTMELAVMKKYPEVPYNIRFSVSPYPPEGERKRVFKSAGHSNWSSDDLQTAIREGICMTVCDARIWGYWANVERNFVLGKPKPEVMKHFKVMIEMHNAALDVMKPGNIIPDVDWTAKAVLIKNGYSRFQPGSGCGRGIVHFGGGQTGGRELRSDLRIYNDYEFKPGMVFSLEPSIRVAGVGVFRHCSTVVITEKGHEVWSRIPYDLIVK